jgi:hypothetical protein
VTVIVKLSRVLGRTFAGVLLISMTFYLLLWAINFHDEAPSVAVHKMQVLQHAPADITADNNGYIFLRQHTAAQPQRASEPFRQLIQQCKQADCATVLSDAAPQLTSLITEHKPLLAFYQRLRGFSHWYEPTLTDVMTDTPAYSGLLDAQQLFLLQAWLSAQQQDMTQVREILQQDLQYWRAVLPKNNSLRSKMISEAAIKTHFTFATLIQRQFEPQLQAQMIPQVWLHPFTEAELNLMQVASGEWALGRGLLEQAFAQPYQATQSLPERIGLTLLLPLLLPQATLNDNAQQLLSAAKGEASADRPWYSWLYNPIGKILNQNSNEYFAYYRQRLLALEPLRQQAVAMPPQNLVAD